MRSAAGCRASLHAANEDGEVMELAVTSARGSLPAEHMAPGLFTELRNWALPVSDDATVDFDSGLLLRRRWQNR